MSKRTIPTEKQMLAIVRERIIVDKPNEQKQIEEMGQIELKRRFRKYYKGVIDEIQSSEANRNVKERLDALVAARDSDVHYNEIANFMLKNIPKVIEDANEFFWSQYKTKLTSKTFWDFVAFSGSSCSIDSLYYREYPAIVYQTFIRDNKTLYRELCELYSKAKTEEYYKANPISETIYWNDGKVNNIRQSVRQIYNHEGAKVLCDINSLDILKAILEGAIKKEEFADIAYVYNDFTELLNELEKYGKKKNKPSRVGKRHFILHVGDTNTGKTYEAIQDLKNASTGVYLSPLRLLALEVQETLNDAGVKCSLLTGEEYENVENATHVSSTVEMLDGKTHYDVCVIDEAQMVEDNNRGWAWTRALYEADADKIHVCMAPNAEKIVLKIIEDCGDSYEIKHHTRNTKLSFEDKAFSFPDDVQPYDALVVFSRKEVYRIAKELEKCGIKSSILYGALPYDVRKSELKKFQEGMTNVIVCTDAIGMGVNLPIRRIVFMASEKYDGRYKRPLIVPEVRQIAGRAGRFGMYDEGFVNAYENRNYIHNKLYEEYSDIDKISINYPLSIVKYGAPLSIALRLWNATEIDKELFVKCDVSEVLKLCEFQEDNFAFSKEEMLLYATIPFDTKNRDAFDLWKYVLRRLAAGDFSGEKLIKALGCKKMSSLKDEDVESLENLHKKFDVASSFARILDLQNEYAEISKLKNEVNNILINKLQDKTKITKLCRDCGRELPIDFPYNICENCYEERNSWRKWNFDW